MATLRYLNPIDQPVGTFRLIDWMESNFNSTDYNEFKCLVAFMKITPFYKLHESIQAWNSRGNTLEAIIGIDHKGTSYQALQYVLANFDTVDILHVEHSTFHPKLYIFHGTAKATAYYGSSNFTSGGLETNFEGGVIIDYEFPKDQLEFNTLVNNYLSVASSSVSCATRLTVSSLEKMKAEGLLLDEADKPKTAPKTKTTFSGSATPSSSLFGDFSIKPARPIPKSVMKAAAESAGITMEPIKSTSKKRSTSITSGVKAPVVAPSAPVVLPIIANGFVVQVSPHDNGEIHLSKVALDQNQAFFGVPFTGATVPKKAGNPSYPQRVPDPVVNIRVFDKTGALVNSVSEYSLNTIFYTKKSEIRITITPSILADLHVATITTDYPILVMRASSDPKCDYDLDFYEYGSSFYDSYLLICNQTLPSGGKAVARKMGWF